MINIQYDKENGTVIIPLDLFINLIGNQKPPSIAADYDKPAQTYTRGTRYCIATSGPNRCTRTANHEGPHHDIEDGRSWP